MFLFPAMELRKSIQTVQTKCKTVAWKSNDVTVSPKAKDILPRMLLRFIRKLRHSNPEALVHIGFGRFGTGKPIRLAACHAAVRICAKGFGAIFHFCCEIASLTAGTISAGIFRTSRTNALNSAESSGNCVAASISAYPDGFCARRAGS
jgi:hypothetical protein